MTKSIIKKGIFFCNFITIYLVIILVNSTAFSASSADDKALYSLVAEKLEFEPQLDASNITILIKGNADIVVLGGTVKYYAEKSVAEDVVKNIRGVKGVIDEISVSSLLWKKQTNDSEITESALKAIKSNVLIADENIKIITKNGHVTLSGEVPWHFQKRHARTAISFIHGIQHITNNIVVCPTVDAIDIAKVKQQIAKEFETHARIDSNNVQIITVGQKIILKGKVRSFDERELAENIAWSVSGVKEVENELILDF